MTIEEIIIIKLSAAEGKVLTDGEKYAKEIYLPEDGDPYDWEEVDEPEESNDNFDEDISELEDINE